MVDTSTATATALDELFELLAAKAVQTYEEDKYHSPLVFTLVGRDVTAVLPVAHIIDDREAFRRAIRGVFARGGCDGYAMVTESWMSLASAGVKPEDRPAPSKDPARIEVLTVHLVSKAVTPRYCRVRTIKISMGFVIDVMQDQRETPAAPLSGLMLELLP